MSDIDQHGPVVVGIDGSRAGVHAATWAIDEAIDRDVPLHLVHATRIAVTTKSFVDDYQIDKEYAETALREAAAAVQATEKAVKVECFIRHGLASDALADESRGASLMCVGSEGIGRVASAFFGSTATDVAIRAHCPVAIVHRPELSVDKRPKWIAMPVNGPHDADEVIEAAMNEARIRDLPVLAVGTWQEDVADSPHDELDRTVDGLRERHPDVRMYPVATRADIGRFLNECDEPVSLAVIGPADVPHVIHMRPSPERGERTILIVRH
ncbi:MULTISPECIES: universal stress protein [Mycobacteroides]|uniref:Universal stress protein n=1 Tax=Mycobacteroides chelonae TaxID=1774 RepID=A0A1S1M1A4_MYCCH|nr:MULTISPECIES: universal stress protein [Mycobacteroides]KRQ25429.1 universal stress protein [Mycobacteroides sp. H003]KRQ31889.1 universal stress protein [Mycobacteroides sp. H092]KRQ34903.1 universal stress protein [Mycobacteroides sp. H101]KRQ53290.1 universal stress protein [Mycobacteroides sp. H063]KRQ60384.1 universal stress protein [Mycobacteroides sp. H079]